MPYAVEAATLMAPRFAATYRRSDRVAVFARLCPHAAPRRFLCDHQPPSKKKNARRRAESSVGRAALRF